MYYCSIEFLIFSCLFRVLTWSHRVCIHIHNMKHEVFMYRVPKSSIHVVYVLYDYTSIHTSRAVARGGAGALPPRPGLAPPPRRLGEFKIFYYCWIKYWFQKIFRNFFIYFFIFSKYFIKIFLKFQIFLKIFQIFTYFSWKFFKSFQLSSR